MKADLINAGALVIALCASMTGVLLQSVSDPQPAAGARGLAPQVDTTTVVDARGVAVPMAAYQRIVSLNPVSDHLLLRLVEPRRLIAVTDTTAHDHPESWRFGDRGGVARADPLETVLGDRPDLVIVSKFIDEALITRLREEGIQVFDLGEMRGIRTTLESVRALGALVGEPERAALLERRIQREVQALEEAVVDAQRPPGLYLSVYGDSTFGGTAGTSYSDLLRLGGVHDLAADHGYRDWPQYSPEELLELNPALIVTQEGMARTICSHGILRLLAACSPNGRVVEIPGQYHTDPGLGLLVAAQSVQDLVHPELHPSSASTFRGGGAPPSTRTLRVPSPTLNPGEPDDRTDEP